MDGEVRVFYVAGLGKREKAGEDSYRTTSALIAKRAKRDKVKSLYIYAGEIDHRLSKAIILRHLLGYLRKAYGVYHIPWLIH